MIILNSLKRLRPRERWSLSILAGLALGALLLWGPIQRQLVTVFVLREDAPSQAVISSLAEQSSNPAALLKRLWDSGKIPHRLAVLAYLREPGKNAPTLLAEMDSVLVAAAQDGDAEVRELALALLAKQNHPDLLRLAEEQLRDADPGVRLLGLQYLHKTADSRLVPLVFPLLDDSDLRVVASADNALRRWTGNDFGIRLSHAAPLYHQGTPKEPSPASAEAFSRGVQRWREWWKLHRGEYPNPAQPALRSASPARLPAPDFLLEDLGGKPVRLSDFKGKVVLLNFWDTATPACLSLISNLVEVQRRQTNGLVVLGLSLETTAPERSHEHEHAHEHGGSAHAQPDLAQIRARLLETAQAAGVTYPVLVDATGAVGRRFNASDLPTNVLIDADGFVRRRFVGLRTPKTLIAMLDEIDRAKPSSP